MPLIPDQGERKKGEGEAIEANVWHGENREVREIIEENRGRKRKRVTENRGKGERDSQTKDNET